MKRMLMKRLYAVIAIVMLLLLGLCFFWQLYLQKNSVWHKAGHTATQLQQIMEKNDREISTLVASLKENYIIRAKAAAYLLDEGTIDESDVRELKKIASLLQVDEIHLFDQTGVIVSGTHPQYYGYSFDSGEQMAFFRPMLTNKHMSMCQNLVPNTADSNPMMYAITWRPSGNAMVQVGLKPERLLEILSRNELPYIFSRMPQHTDYSYYVVDKANLSVLGSTQKQHIGKTFNNLSIRSVKGADPAFSFQTNVAGKAIHGTILEYADSYICVAFENRLIFENIPTVMAAVFLCLLLVSIILFAQIMHYLDRTVLKDINEMNQSLTAITSGDLSTHVEIASSPEFATLSSNVNLMVSTLSSNARNLSHIIDSFNTLVGFFDCHEDAPFVFASDKLDSLLMLDPQRMEQLLSDKNRFLHHIRKISKHPVPYFHNVYQPDFSVDYFIKIDLFENDREIFGVIRDMTEEVTQQQRLRLERNHDLLTGLLARRAFYEQLDLLFASAESLGHCVMMMLDMDHLKPLNDDHGHATGDRALHTIATLLNTVDSKRKLISRLGGDEFAIFIYGEEDEPLLRSYICDLHARMMEAKLEVHGVQLPIRLSAGCVFSSDPCCSYHDLLQMADAALYASKKHGRSCFSVYDPVSDSYSCLRCEKHSASQPIDPAIPHSISM